MAESVIAYVAQNLTDLLVQKAEFLRGIGGQVEWLRDELQRMQCFLKDAGAKQEEDERVHNWVTEIRSAAYDAEDIVDAFVLKIESWRRHGFVKRYAHIFKEIIDLRKVGKEIEAFWGRIHDISRSCETYGIKRIGVGTSCTSRERLLLGIIREVIKPTKKMLENMDNRQEEGFERILSEHLQKKRYLVVLEDIWTTEAWDILKRAFPDVDNGSKGMLTTRNRDVALHADARTTPYELRLLGKEESWELFLKKAFLGSIGENYPQEFEDIGRRIVEKCDGLPLAISVGAEPLSRKCLLSEWERVPQ